jgi:hypothetical protein
MSELSLFQNGSQLPAHLRRGELNAITKALMGNSNKRISIEGGSFRLIVGGQEVAVKEERFMNVIMLRAADTNTRTYYEGTYVKGSKAKPVCWSSDSMVPHEDVKNPQSSKCNTCPQNIRGSGQNDSRACRYQRRLAVLLENDIHGDIYAMSIPAASIFDNGEGRKMGLQQYARFLGGHGIDVNAVLTEMRFDTNATAPKLTFSAVRPLEEDEYATVLERKDEQFAIDAVTMTVSQLDEAEAPTGEVPAPAPAPTRVQAPPPAPTPAPAAAKATPKATPKASGFAVTKKEEAAAPVAEPEVREVVKTVAPASDMNSLLSQWGDDVDD